MSEQVNHHNIKCHPNWFDQIKSGLKKFEFRKNDRSYKLGDKVTLNEYDPEKKEHTGKTIETSITSIIYSHEFDAIPDGYCIFSLNMGEPSHEKYNDLKSQICKAIDENLSTLENMSKAISGIQHINFDMTIREDFKPRNLKNGLIIHPNLILTTNPDKFKDDE